MLNKSKYMITLAKEKNIDQIYELCQERVKWFRENEIDQWHVLEKSDLKKILSREMKRGDLYKVTYNNKIVGSFVLSLTDSKHWELYEDTYYLWRLVTSLNCHGVGKSIIKFCRKKCKEDKKKYLRGYYVASNDKLKEIYHNYGFTVVDEYKTASGKILNMIEMKIIKDKK